MWAFFRDVLIYVIGGLTFLPLVVIAIFLHGYFTLPHVSQAPQPAAADVLHDAADDGRNIRKGSEGADGKLRKSQEKEIGGYFAVSREWIPGGVSGKPPERGAPPGAAISDESPSVYQSMYRSLFDRRQVPTLDEPRNGNGKPSKRVSNVFYVVLRHGHLMLYDDSEQVEVRYVISLAYHDVTVYGGGDELPEGELWIKRNAIQLSRKAPVVDSMEVISKPFFLFSENCSEKEDFYFAILQHQERNATEEHPPPLVQHFELKHIIKLVQTLHSSEEHLQTRWFNALLGRLFLSIYKTPEIEQFIRQKITKKIARAKKPNFISGIRLQKIDLGESAPFVTNPRLKDLTVDGDCCVEADVRYDGKFRIEIAMTAKVDLGARFKAREFDLVLAITVKKLEGHAMLRFKPPPSNRMWYSFEKMPRMELQIEPIVSSRQITYGVILRAIESRIREVFAETLVVPHWDDSAFHSTLGQHFRGGIWVHELQHFQSQAETVVPDETETETEAIHPGDEPGLQSPPLPPEANDSRPSLIKSPADKPEKPMSRLFQRKPVKAHASPDVSAAAAATSAFQKQAEPPRAIRTHSFASAASPVISPDTAESAARAAEVSSKSRRDAASAMAELSHRSQPSSPELTPTTSNDETASTMEREKSADGASRSSSDMLSGQRAPSSSRDAPPLTGIRKASAASTGSSTAPPPTRLQNVARTLTPSAKKQQSLGAAALAAKSWGWKTLTKGRGAGTQPPPGTPPPDISQPMGRGQPLPPPGQPLPHPGEVKASTPPTLPPRKTKSRSASYDAGRQLSMPKSAPPDILVHGERGNDEQPEGDGVMVVAAPIDSGPPSPARPGTDGARGPTGENDDDSYGEFMDNIPDEDERPPRADGLGIVHGTENSSDEAVQGDVSGLTTHAADEDMEATVHSSETIPEAPTHGRDMTPDAPARDDPGEAGGATPQATTATGREGHDSVAESAAEEDEHTNITPSEMTEEDALHAAWRQAEEEETRSKSVWMEESDGL